MLRQLRERSNRTQGQMAVLLNLTERQYQRFEAGDSKMPLGTWKLLRSVWGSRHPIDFEVVTESTRGWDTRRDTRRDTIERGDVVELQPIVGPLLRATVCMDRVHDGLGDEDGYGAFVIEFVGADGAGQEYLGFYIGERVRFARENVIHLEQRAPRR
ncbi:helix-turn-helix domain-containing protein [Burkholderia sp. WTPI3]|nr:helix-turn-helix transcriptional regulator [Burkholderia sp. WTPI3]